MPGVFAIDVQLAPPHIVANRRTFLLANAYSHAEALGCSRLNVKYGHDLKRVATDTIERHRPILDRLVAPAALGTAQVHQLRRRMLD